MISVTILAKDCAKQLQETLEATCLFPEVLVYDTGSMDATMQVAQAYPNVRVVRGAFIGFGPTHNAASARATHDWILSIDSDEVLSAELAREILQLSLDPRCVYSFERENFFRGKRIKWCGGWYPDRVVRLYHRGRTRFSEDAVHERVLTEGLAEVPLVHHARHTPYLQIADFLSKMQTYTTLFAEQNAGKRRGSVGRALVHGCCAFLKSYLFRRGFLGGSEGLIISLYNGHTALYKYLKLAEKG